MIIKPINIKLTSERKQFSTPSQVHLVFFFFLSSDCYFFSGETFYTIFSQQYMNFYHHKSSSSPKKLFLYLWYTWHLSISQEQWSCSLSPWLVNWGWTKHWRSMSLHHRKHYWRVKHKGSKWYWIKKQLGPSSIHPSRLILPSIDLVAFCYEAKRYNPIFFASCLWFFHCT